MFRSRIKKLVNKVFEQFWEEAMDWLAEEPRPKEISDAEKIRDLQAQVQVLEERIDKLDGTSKKHEKIWS